ncbi:MAG: CDP-alcohol phosphatidyltransferase family protein [Actinomycetota bacterium]|nr:CDP-alcohol phosphatidyltransferase family protein [Actinomycetota bacterium]
MEATANGRERGVGSVEVPPGGGVPPEPATPIGVDTDPDRLDRVLTVPNGITVVRLACIPLFVWLLFGARRQTDAAVLLGALGATDWIDGQVARRWHQVSTLGKVLDPVADRLLVGTAVIAVVVYGAVPVWFAAATLAREALVSAAVLVLASLGAERIDVLVVGKAGTFALMFAYPAFLLGDGRAVWQGDVRLAAWTTGVVGLALAWVAAGAYVPVARRALHAGRAGEAGRRGGTAT